MASLAPARLGKMVVSAVASNWRRYGPGAWPFRVVLGIVASLGVAACSGRSSDDDDAPNPVTPENFVDQAADAICGNVGGCCQSSGFTFDRAGCESYVRSVVDSSPTEGTVWDSTEAGRCIAALASVARACDADAGDVESCTRIRRGTVQEGEPCTGDTQCADIGGEQALCDYDDALQIDVCTAQAPTFSGGLGDDCDGTCTGTSCTHIVDEGAPPRATCFVEDHLVCDFTAGVCIPSPDVGEPCASYYCSPGAYCTFDTTVCASTKPLGSSCVESDECSDGLCDQMVCRAPTLASQGICTGQ